MTTPYSKVYNIFLSKIRDYPLLDQIQADEDFVEQLLYDYMSSAIAHYTYSNNRLNDRDEEEKAFKTSLTSLEIEILSMFMVYVYLSQHIINTEKITERLTSKDFHLFSPANLIREVKEIQEIIYERAVQLMVEEYYRGWY